MRSGHKASFLLSLTIFLWQPGNAQHTATGYDTNTDANAYYLRALHYIEIGNPRTGGSVDSLQIAVQLLEKAVEKDPLFAKAFLELSRTYWRFDFSYPNYPRYFPDADAFLAKSKRAISKALQIDSTFAEAYTDLALINLNHEYNWNEALRNLDKAIKYDPKNPVNFVRYGQILALQGKWNEAQKWIDTAYSLAPTDSRVLLIMGIYYHWKREYKKATFYFTQIKPQTFLSQFYLGYNFVADNNPAKAVETLKTLYPDFENADGGSKALLAYALTKNNELVEAKKLVSRSYELNQVIKYRAAVFYIGMKEYKKAIDYLEKAYQEHSNWMIWLRYDPALDPIRQEKKFITLLNKMKFH